MKVQHVIICSPACDKVKAKESNVDPNRMCMFYMA